MRTSIGAVLGMYFDNLINEIDLTIPCVDDRDEIVELLEQARRLANEAIDQAMGKLAKVSLEVG